MWGDEGIYEVIVMMKKILRLMTIDSEIDNMFNSFQKNSYKMILRWILIFIGPLLIFGSLLYFLRGMILFGVIEVSIGFIISSMILINHFSLEKKTILVTIILYAFSYFLLITTGSKGGGLASLLMATVMIAIVVYKKRHYIIAFAIHILIVLCLSLMLYLGSFDQYDISGLKDTWIFLSVIETVFSLLIILVFYFYRKSINRVYLDNQHLIYELDNIINAMHCSIIAVDNKDHIIHINKKSMDFFGFPFDFAGESFSDIVTLVQKTELDISLTEDAVFGFKGSTYSNKVLQMKDRHGCVMGKLIITDDVSQQLIHEQKLKYLADHDHLTGIFNRRGLMDYLTSKEEIENLAIFYIDLDNFKHYNDLRGHSVGDQILIEFSKRLERIQSNTIMVSRFGGDEFVVAVFYSDQKDVNHVADCILEQVRYDLNIDNKKCYLVASVGVAMRVSASTSLHNVIENAEFAMRLAKKEHRTKLVFFDSKLQESRMHEVEVVDLLHYCISNDGFEMVYQPIVNTDSDCIIALEALLRIKGQTISPGVFVPIAEKKGLMDKIGRIVIDKVVNQLSTWIKKGVKVVPVYINFSSSQSHDQSLVNYIQRSLLIMNVDVSLLGVEITEDTLLDNKELVSETVRKLKQLGLKTSIDDFGSGQAGINYLTNFEVDMVKIGKQFTDKYLNIQSVATYEAVVKLCDSLGFTVLAEGIESLYQVNLLKHMSVHVSQGYYYFKPLKVKEIEIILGG